MVCIVLSRLQAEDAYLTELSKWNASDRKDAALLEEVGKLKIASQGTAFESQLARSLRKEDQKAKVEGVVKYCALYAGVPRDAVCVQLWHEAQKVLKKRS